MLYIHIYVKVFCGFQSLYFSLVVSLLGPSESLFLYAVYLDSKLTVFVFVFVSVSVFVFVFVFVVLFVFVFVLMFVFV